MPHREIIGPFGVDEDLGLPRLEIVHPYVRRHAAAVALPGARLGREPREGDLRGVGRVAMRALPRRAGASRRRRRPSARYRAWRSAGRDSSSIPASSGRECAPRGMPIEGEIRERMEGQPLRDAALDGDREEIGIAVIIAGKGDRFAVRGEFRETLAPGMGREPLRRAAARRDDPEIAAVRENDLVPVNVGVTHEPALGGRSGRGRAADDPEDHKTKNPPTHRTLLSGRKHRTSHVPEIELLLTIILPAAE